MVATRMRISSSISWALCRYFDSQWGGVCFRAVNCHCFIGYNFSSFSAVLLMGSNYWNNICQHTIQYLLWKWYQFKLFYFGVTTSQTVITVRSNRINVSDKMAKNILFLKTSLVFPSSSPELKRLDQLLVPMRSSTAKFAYIGLQQEVLYMSKAIRTIGRSGKILNFNITAG